jgi:hypothetical protein
MRSRVLGIIHFSELLFIGVKVLFEGHMITNNENTAISNWNTEVGLLLVTSKEPLHVNTNCLQQC